MASFGNVSFDRDASLKALGEAAPALPQEFIEKMLDVMLEVVAAHDHHTSPVMTQRGVGRERYVVIRKRGS